MAYAGLDLITAPTQHVAASVIARGLHVAHLPYGAPREILAERSEQAEQTGSRHRVLFWREGTEENGADLCLYAFLELARRHPEVTFTFALRASRHEVDGIDAAARTVPNIEVHRFPYSSGPNLADLVGQALLVCLPFRRQTIYPQLAVLESLSSGVPVVCLNVGDIPEFVHPGETGWIVDSATPAELAAAISSALESADLASMGMAARDLPVHRAWTEFVPTVERLYDHVLRARAGRALGTVNDRMRASIRDCEEGSEQ